MKRNVKIALIYLGVGVLCLAMILFFRRVGAAAPDAELPIISNEGKEEVTEMFPIEEDFELTNQDGERVKLSDIKGEVTLIAEFFAVCPHCAIRNGKELVEIYQHFGDHPDFRIVCITVDPETDQVPQLKAYADALEADARNWWFARGDGEQATHEYLENVLRFFKIRRWRDPVDIASNGKFAHDMGFLLVNRQFEVIGKYPLVAARSDEAEALDPGRYGRLKEQMFDRIRTELDKVTP